MKLVKVENDNKYVPLQQPRIYLTPFKIIKVKNNTADLRFMIQIERKQKKDGPKTFFNTEMFDVVVIVFLIFKQYF